MLNNKRLLVILCFLLVAGPAVAYRIPRPVPLDFPPSKDGVTQLNDSLENIWNLTNGEYNLDEVETTKSNANNGDIWVFDSPLTAKIQYKSDGAIYSVCVEGGGNCTTGGAASATTPGGSNPQLQYNNAGAFGGVTASGADANWNVGLGTSVPTQQLELTKNLEMVDSTATEGIIYHGATPFLHSFGTNNLFLGDGAGNLTLSGATDNTIIGQGAGVGFTSGDSNTCMGSGSCAVLNNDYDLVAVGYNAMGAVADQNGSIAIGTSALYTGTGSGAYNIAIGPEAMETATTAAENIAIGSKTMESIDSGQANTAVGYNSMILITDAYYNTAIGANSAKTLRTGFDNTFLGYASGNAITIGSNNSCVGSVSCDSVTSGVSNSVLGFSAGETLTTGSGNTLLGYNSEPSTATIDNTVGIGTGVVAGIRGVVIGAEAGNAGSTADDSIFIGYQSGNAITGGDFNTCSGSQSCAGLTTGDANVVMGYHALNVGTNSDSNVCLGFESCLSLTSASDTIAIGTGAGDSITDGTDNVAIGTGALDDNVSGLDNVAIGTGALGTATASNNVSVGVGSGSNLSTGQQNVFMGLSAGKGTFGSNTTDNSVFIGYNSGLAISTGDNNTCIGSGSCDALTTGGTNIVIGYDIDAPGDTESNKLTIGNILFGTNINATDKTIDTDANIGIGTSAPIQRLEIVGGLELDHMHGVFTDTSGIDFSTFRNSWTSSQTTTDFFDISAVSLSTATGLVVKVDNSMTTGRALQILGGSAGATPIFGVDDAITYLPQVSADPCGGDTLKEAGFFYNTTSDYLCFCNSAGADKQAHSPSTDCF